MNNHMDMGDMGLRMDMGSMVNLGNMGSMANMGNMGGMPGMPGLSLQTAYRPPQSNSASPTSGASNSAGPSGPSGGNSSANINSNSTSTTGTTRPGRDTTPPELTATGCVRRKRVRTVTGCLVCRRRRVKCDEARPRCKNCSKHPDRICEYQYPAGGATQQADPTVYPPPLGVNLGPGPPQNTSSLPQYTQMPAPTRMPLSLQQSQFPDLAQQIQQREPEDRKPKLQPEPPSDPSFYPPPADPSFYPPPAGSNPPEFNLFSHSNASAPRLTDPVDPLDSSHGIDSMGNMMPMSFLPPGPDGIRRPIPFMEMDSDDNEAHLLATATTYLSGGLGMPGPEQRAGYAHNVMEQYFQVVRRRSSAQATFDAHFQAQPTQSQVQNGPLGGVPQSSSKLSGAAFADFLSQLVHPAPGKWKEQLAVGVEWAESRGGPGWLLGVSPPRPGFTVTEHPNVQPLAMTVNCDMTALLSVVASLSDGTVPGYLTSDPSWLISSRALQLHLSPGMPDMFEAVVATPRIVIPVFARAVALVSRRLSVSAAFAPNMVLEMLEFDAAALRTELESAWPQRLASRPDTRRLQYGARIWVAAALLLTVHAAQGMPAEQSDVADRVRAFCDLCADAAADLGDLNGWAWPILIVGCAATGEHRQRCKDLVSLAKSTLVDKDHTPTVVQILDKVYAAHDRGERHFHLHHAMRNHPELDILLL